MHAELQFEWDRDKDSSNEAKHGIGFSKAKELWNDSGLTILPSIYELEDRFLAIGRIKDKHWTAIFTEREDKIRLISVRRSRDTEEFIYEQNQ